MDWTDGLQVFCADVGRSHATASPGRDESQRGRAPHPALAVRRKGRLVKRLALEASGQRLYKSRELGLGEATESRIQTIRVGVEGFR